MLRVDEARLCGFSLPIEPTVTHSGLDLESVQGQKIPSPLMGFEPRSSRSIAQSTNHCTMGTGLSASVFVHFKVSASLSVSKSLCLSQSVCLRCCLKRSYRKCDITPKNKTLSEENNFGAIWWIEL